MTRELVYGRRPVYEALRGPRDVLELHASERALGSEAWLREQDGLRVRIAQERDLAELAGTRDHQGVVAICEPFRYADGYGLAATHGCVLVCLDGVTDPQNLGAVARSAEGAGATGLVVPAHRTARVTPAVCRASAGAVEHLPVAVVPNLARFVADVKGPELWAYAAVAGASTPLWEADLTGGVLFVLGAEGTGIRPLVRRQCDVEIAIPLAGRVESLNVSVAAALVLFEVVRRRAAVA
jgi:23S rRNA (guanosine2251-2'-O)-methyltransferase